MIVNDVDYVQYDDHPDDFHCLSYISLERNKITINTFCADTEVDNNDDDSRLSKVIIMMTMINVYDADQYSTYIALTDVDDNDDDN